MYRPIFLETENELNKILRKQKKSKRALTLLFTSLWDDQSNKILSYLKKDNFLRGIDESTELEYRKGVRPLYVANSFFMPHSFVIFKTFKVPALVRVTKDFVKCEDYVPRIYEELGL